MRLRDSLLGDHQDNDAIIIRNGAHFTAHGVESAIKRAMNPSEQSVLEGGISGLSLSEVDTQEIVNGLCKYFRENEVIKQQFSSINVRQSSSYNGLNLKKGQYGDLIVGLGDNELVINRNLIQKSNQSVFESDQEKRSALDKFIVDAQKLPSSITQGQEAKSLGGQGHHRQ